MTPGGTMKKASIVVLLISSACAPPAVPPTTPPSQAATAPMPTGGGTTTTGAKSTVEGVGALKSVDTAALAKKLVIQSANIHEKEVVFLSGGPNDLALLDDLAVEVRKLGATPVVNVTTERRIRRFFDETTPASDLKAADAELKLNSVITADISVDFIEHPDFLASVPADRRSAMSKAFQPVTDARLKHNVKVVNLGNGLYPTDALAERFGMSKEALSKVFWSGVEVDYAKLQATGAAVSKRLSAGKELAITNPNGTDLKMKIAARPVLVSDGVVSDDDVKKGGAACLVWLPAGEVYLAPVAGTAEGKMVIDRSFSEGQEILGLEMVFKAGKVTSMSAKSGLEKLKPLYDLAAAGKDEFGFVDIGINSNVVAPPGSKLQSYVPAGMVTLGIGGNTWAGGANAAAFQYQGFVAGSTVTIDGKPLVEKGELKP